MTKPEKEQLKANIKKVMIDHLTSIGYPNITEEQIMQQLKSMWIKLEEANLIKSGMNYKQFVDLANSQFMFAQVKKAMGI